MPSSSDVGQNAVMLPALEPPPRIESGEHVSDVGTARSLLPEPGVLVESVIPKPMFAYGPASGEAPPFNPSPPPLAIWDADSFRYAVCFCPGQPVIAGLDHTPVPLSVSVNVPLKHLHVTKPDTVTCSVDGSIVPGHSGTVTGDGLELPHASVRVTSKKQ